MRFSGIFDAVLIVIAFRRQELRDLIDAACAAATEGAGRKAHRLTDFEFVHTDLYHVEWNCALPHGSFGRLLSPASSETLLPRIRLAGDFSGCHFAVNGGTFPVPKRDERCECVAAIALCGTANLIAQ